jgi:Tol biopolymer transport system component
MSRARRLTALLLISIVAGHATPRAATLFDPALRFRMLPTDHFVIYFHQGEDRLAGRLALIAEETWTTLRQSFDRTPPRKTHVVLVDQWEAANGYATPLPRDTVVISAAWPEGVDFIGNVDDWLRMVFTHEFTHIVHLDRSQGWARAVRAVLGRTAIAFPNLYLPTWQIEGLATYEESAVTGTGRLHAGDFRAVTGEEARVRALQPLDRVNGGLTDWPSGLGPYAYGLDFHQYLVDRFGPASLWRLADETSRRLPYLTTGAFRQVFNESLGTLWKDFQATLVARSTPVARDPRIVRVTQHGFVASGPRFDKFAANSLVYVARTPHGFPALNRVRLDGTPPDRIVRRYFGETTALAADTIYFDQQEYRRNVGLYSDLYALSRADHHVTRLTTEARLLDPDLSPDGTTIVCVQQKPGQRDLVLVRLKPDATYDTATAASGSYVASAFRRTITTLLSEPETQFNAPRWSPDGRVIAVERHRPGGLSQVVLVDVDTRRIRALVWNGQARMATPAWRPDGRAVVIALAPQEGPFNLWEYSLDLSAPPRQITYTTGGATWPDVSADSRTIAFAGYTVDGFDVFTMPYPTEPALGTETRAGATADAVTSDTPVGVEFPASAMTSATTYSPFPTLRPTSWSPVIETDIDQVRLGAAIAGYDVLGYHFYAASATWLTSGPDDAPKPRASTPDWNLYYAYGRWRPVFWVTAESSTSFFAGPVSATDEPLPVTLRQRQIEGGVLFPVNHARVSHQALGSLLRSQNEFTPNDGTGSLDRAAIRGGWSTATARFYGYSISFEHGIRVGGTAEAVRRALGSSQDASTLTGDFRLYAPMPAAHHVLALRLAGGSSTGDVNSRRNFLLGGAGPNPAVVDFDRDAISLLRGFPANRFAGSHVALLNVDYRFPVARPQRGAGTWPLFVHSLYAAAFADAGHAWTNRFDANAVKTSVGGELSSDLIFGFFFPLTTTVGAAWGHDGSGAAPDRTTFYFRVGRAF